MCEHEGSEFRCMRGWPPRSSAREKERLDTGGLTANNDHIGGVEDLTRERKSAQSADRVVVKYLDRKARAPTAKRRSRSGAEPRSGVGGARRGVREYGAVNYHKVALEGRKCELVVSPDLAVLPVVACAVKGDRQVR